MQRMFDMVAALDRPDSNVSLGALTAQSTYVGVKFGVAELCSRLATKCSEALQTIVVRQS
jgi:hypothetical protein